MNLRNVVPAIVPAVVPAIVLMIPLLAAARSASDGVYTKVQAERGKAAYGQHCAKCHSDDLAGGDESPTLKGPEFLGRWKKNTVGAVFNFMRKTMPTDEPGHLTAAQYADITAFILSANGFPEGANELESDPAKLLDTKIAATP